MSITKHSASVNTCNRCLKHLAALMEAARSAYLISGNAHITGLAFRVLNSRPFLERLGKWPSKRVKGDGRWKTPLT